MSLGNMEQRMEGMKKQAKELIEQAYQRGYKAGYEEGKGQTWSEEVKKYEIEPEKALKYIEQGRNNAWEAAGKLVPMDYKECNKVLCDGFLTIEYAEDIFIRCTASEAIEKLRAYEEQKKQEEDAEIHVGDEVRSMYSEIIGIVTHISEIEGFSILWRDGSVGKRKNISDFKKTGRHLPEIAEILKKLQEGE